MPAAGISLPPKKDFGTSRWGGSKIRLHQKWREIIELDRRMGLMHNHSGGEPPSKTGRERPYAVGATSIRVQPFRQEEIW
jgi:hypothetical protein